MGGTRAPGEMSRDEVATRGERVAQAGMLVLHARGCLGVDRRERMEVRTGAFGLMEFERGEAVRR